MRREIEDNYLCAKIHNKYSHILFFSSRTLSYDEYSRGYAISQLGSENEREVQGLSEVLQLPALLHG